MSSTVCGRRIGTFFTAACSHASSFVTPVPSAIAGSSTSRHMNVSTSPGQMAFTVTSNWPISSASACVKPITAHFDAQ